MVCQTIRVLEVRENFKQGQAAAESGEFQTTRHYFHAALDVCEKNAKRCAIHLHIGNAYARERKHLKAAEHFGISLSEANKARDRKGIASALASVGNTCLHRPASTPEERAQNVRKAIACCKQALEIYKKTPYPQTSCATAANLGMALLDIGEKDEARNWLAEAWSLRQFLPDQGKKIRKSLDDLSAGQ